MNTLLDADYPITGKALQVDFYKDGEESSWEINPGKSSKKDEYVSIESNNKPGLYITAQDPKNGVITPGTVTGCKRNNCRSREHDIPYLKRI